MIQRWLTIRTIFCSCTFALYSLSRVEHVPSCSVELVNPRAHWNILTQRLAGLCWLLSSPGLMRANKYQGATWVQSATSSEISRYHRVQMGTVSSSIRLQLEESRAIATALVAISQGLCQLCTQSPWTLRLGHDMGTRKSWMRLLCFPEWAHDSSRTKKNSLDFHNLHQIPRFEPRETCKRQQWPD